jgi:hypothetical protein
LEKNIVSIKLSNELNKAHRPTADALKSSNVMQSAGAALSKCINTDALKASLENRPDAGDVKEGIIKTEMDARKDELKAEMVKDSLEKALNTTTGRRPTVEDISAAGILKDSVRDKSDSLSKALAADKLSKEVKRRSSAEDLKAAGILKSAVDSGVCKLEASQRKESLSKAVAKRPSMQSVGEAGLLKQEDVVHDAVDHSSVQVAVKEEEKVKATEEPVSVEEPKKKKGLFGLW